MARVKNATFVGASPSEVDVDSPTWKRVIKNAIGDLALIYDKITGENSETEVVNHDGTPGRGARLGIPWINQCFSGRDDRVGQWGVDLTYFNPGTPGTKAGTATDTIVFGAPVFVPAGESDMTVVITGMGLGVWPWRVELRQESDFSMLFQGDLTHRAHASGYFEELRLSTSDNGTDATSGTGTLCLLLIYADTTARLTPGDTAPDGQIRAYSLFAGPTRRRVSIGSSSPQRRDDDVFNITTASDRMVWRDFDSSLFADRTPLHAYLMGGASRNLNALIEYITGWPAGGNATYHLIDSADTDPDSAFMAHTQSVFADEPALDFPIIAQCFGAAQLSGNAVVEAVPPATGLLDWYGLIPISTALARHVGWRLAMPDFPNGSPSQLRACVLAMSADHTEGALWKVQWDLDPGAGASSSNVFATVGSTALMTSKHTAAQVNFIPDEVTAIDMNMTKTAAKVQYDELIVLGCCLYFERP